MKSTDSLHHMKLVLFLYFFFFTISIPVGINYAILTFGATYGNLALSFFCLALL